ncbi:MAG: hypothetical protein GY820_36515 [Gammaproteobacteria bacterium]|nr:hypothetical protein [Gammaproteobacteria bacterium]
MQINKRDSFLQSDAKMKPHLAVAVVQQNVKPVVPTEGGFDVCVFALKNTDHQHQYGPNNLCLPEREHPNIETTFSWHQRSVFNHLPLS